MANQVTGTFNESTLYNGFAAPSKIAMVDSMSSGYLMIEGDAAALDIDLSNEFYFGWVAKDRTYQIRWRYRSRRYPTGESSGGWSGWSSWQGASTCGTKTARAWANRVTPSDTQNPNTWFMANARPGKTGSLNTNQYAANQELYRHCVAVGLMQGLGDQSVRDAEQWQVQVRTWGEGIQKHGHHKEATFTIYYPPSTFDVTAVKLNDADGLRVYYTTDWHRDGNTVEITWADGSETVITGVKGCLDGAHYFTIPAAKLDKDYDPGDAFAPARIRLVTCDTGAYVYKDATLQQAAGTVQPLYANESANPTISVQTDEDAHIATVTIQKTGGYSWQKVKVWAGWYGVDGKWTTVFPSSTVSEENYSSTSSSVTKRGVYRFNNVPSDKAVSYRAQVTTAANDANGAATLKTSATMRSKGRAFLSIGARTAALVCALDEAGVTWSRSYSPNVETETCAGRQREVSRHGVGGAASIQIRGDIVYNTAAHDMGEGRRLADWEAMRLMTGADGYIALPQGIWAKVAVTAIDIDTARPAHSVSISLEEVS